MVSIQAIQGREILDSRGHPTVAVTVALSNGIRATAKVPSGASTGSHEAVELRDGDPARHSGRGVLKAVAHVNGILARELFGFDPADQAALDRRMIELDGTPDKSRLGANAILGVSCAAARAAARFRGLELWDHLHGNRTPAMPIPIVNIISGGHHAGHNFEFQDFMVIPQDYPDLSASLNAVASVHRETRNVLVERGAILTGVADEGGWGPRLPSNEAALEVLNDAIQRTGERMSIALDVAATHFFSRSKYQIEGQAHTSAELIARLTRWCERYPIASIEDGLAEDDWPGWQALTGSLGRRLQLVGDDLFATNLTRLERGIRDGAANAVLIKMNQIGTLTETFAVADRARDAGYRAVISARSGETEDDFLADFAVATGAGQIKIGSITRSERLSKYNRLLEIESTLR